MERITILRERLGLSQKDFAEALETTQTTVSRWERGAVKLPAGAAARIARVFNVSYDWLAGKDAPMFITDGTSDVAPKVTPYAFFLSQGFGKITSRFFAALCGASKETKDRFEKFAINKDKDSLQAVFEILYCFLDK